MTAGELLGSEVGKACLVFPFATPSVEGDVCSVVAEFKIPQFSGGRISLLDLECKYCGYSEQPGIRLFLNSDGSVFLDRAKLGFLTSPFKQTSLPLFPFDTWTKLKVKVVMGKGSAGVAKVFINGSKVLEASGTTMPDQNVADEFGVTLTNEQYDRWQVGITANSCPTPVTLKCRF